MEYVYLNCSNDSTCEIQNKEYMTFEQISYLVVLVFSTLGIIFNLISTFILTFSNNSTTKFLQFLKFYSINSFLISLNDFINIICFFSTNSIVYKFDKKSFYKADILNNYIIYLNIWAVIYSISGILDIFIVYERIQQYTQFLKFLRNKTAGKITFGVVLYSIVINIPIGIGRTECHENITISNKSIDVYSYCLRRFPYNSYFVLSILISNFIRDIISLIIEVTLNVILIVTMIRFYKARMMINVQNFNTFAFKRTSINNSKIALFMNFVSSVFHVTTFFFIIIRQYSSVDTYNYISKIFAIVYSFRHSLNFFLFLKLNKKFRRNFYVIVPKCVWKIKFFKRDTVKPQKIVLEHVNLKNMSTYL